MMRIDGVAPYCKTINLLLTIFCIKCPNLLWRLQNGEMPANLNAKIFWLLIGTNDLALGGCSEEAVLLGILRLADEIHFHNKDSRIVIQGILPRTKSVDGTLMTLDKLSKSSPSSTTRLSSSKKKNKLHHVSAFLHDRITSKNDPGRAHDPDEAKKKFHLWPSIQHINKELEKFCSNHEHLIYFDSNDLFLGSLGNKHYRTTNMKIISDLMPDMIHPSYDGYRIMANVITKELSKILNDNDEENYIETQPDNDDEGDDQ
jgi:lysophospholipase L1-like esterase